MSSCASPTRGISWRSPIPGARSRVDARVRPALPPLHRQLHKGGPNTGLFLVVTADDAEDAEISGTLRLRLVPARVRVLEEQPDALAALLPGPVVARRREGQVAQDTLIQRPPDRPRCLHALGDRSEEHTSELQSQSNLVCRLLLAKKKNPEAASTHATD